MAATRGRMLRMGCLFMSMATTAACCCWRDTATRAFPLIRSITATIRAAAGTPSSSMRRCTLKISASSRRVPPTSTYFMESSVRMTTAGPAKASTAHTTTPAPRGPGVSCTSSTLRTSSSGPTASVTTTSTGRPPPRSSACWATTSPTSAASATRSASTPSSMTAPSAPPSASVATRTWSASTATFAPITSSPARRSDRLQRSVCAPRWTRVITSHPPTPALSTATTAPTPTTSSLTTTTSRATTTATAAAPIFSEASSLRWSWSPRSRASFSCG
mmetsp:Transcript_15923/g.28284  ORF Transcript_15923/g.28284 Transcript_15923/m.28284 type:complete len:275 (+) Transcript_15923:1851-2675(+)